jgi:hypothetical protein
MFMMWGEERSEEKIRRRKRGSGMAKGQKLKIKINPKNKTVARLPVGGL